MTAFSLIPHDSITGQFGSGDKQIVQTTCEVAGKPVSFSIRINKNIARLSDIVPLARAICDRICLAVQQALADTNEPISCRKGCSACCSYLVPLSIPEVLHFHDVLRTMNQKDRLCIHQMCGATAKTILSEKNLLKKLEQNKISRWYAELNLPCPFLTNGTCGIYEQRPLACREHMVTGPASLCNREHEGIQNTVKLPFSILEAVGQLAAQLEQTDIEAVMLPLACLGMEEYVCRSRQCWEATKMLEVFLDILKLKSSESIGKYETMTLK